MARPRRSAQLVEPDDLACAVRIVHIDKVQAARRELPRSGVVAGLSELFGALGDPTRLRIVAALATQELCVCDLAATISISESAASHQLRQLRSIGLIRSRRQGRLVFYSLDDDHVTAIFQQALEHVEHQDRGL